VTHHVLADRAEQESRNNAADTVIAGMHINDWDAIESIRRLVGQQPSPQGSRRV
jgi:hypothetical protein